MKQTTGYKKPSYILQAWWAIKHAVNSWFEWEDARYWALENRPAWLSFAMNCRNKKTRQYYKSKILNEYRGIIDD